MINSRHTPKKVTPSVPTGGQARGRKMILKAANDNQMPLSERLLKIFMIAGPVSAGLFFLVVWLLA